MPCPDWPRPIQVGRVLLKTGTSARLNLETTMHAAVPIMGG
jgi:hypothetical protein